MGGRSALGRYRPLVSLLMSVLLLLAVGGGTIAWSSAGGRGSALVAGRGGAIAPQAGAWRPTATEPAAAGPPAATSRARSVPEEMDADAAQAGRPTVTWTPPASPPRPVNPDRLSPAVSLVVYVPHQDDELLSLGVVIARHIRAGDGVRIVVLTDGSASSAREPIDARLAALRLPGLTRAEFAAARDRELLASLAVLGVPPASILRVELPDGHLTEAAAWATISVAVAAYPDALHVATSTSDGHRDHITLARALARARTAGGTTAWAVARSAWDRRISDPGCRRITDPAVAGVLSAAAREYLRWDPAAGRYAIAWHSVPDLLKAAASDPSDLLCDKP